MKGPQELHHSVEAVVGEILVGVRDLVDVLKCVFASNSKSNNGAVVFPWDTIERIKQKAETDLQTLQTLLNDTPFASKDDMVVVVLDGPSEEAILAETIGMLLAGLKRSYQVLDAAVDTSSNASEESKTPPKAPIGLLSLRHYTDICALVEFSICWSILPLPGVLMPIHDRIRTSLPKAIAGRMPGAALVWAVEHSVSKSNLWIAVGQMLVLDRFRPILLPRHLTDLYAAILSDDANPNEAVKDLAHALGVYGASSLIDPVTQARTYQQLLRFGTKAPTALRTRVSQLLSRAAIRNLAAIVAVFVDDDGASAVRLARALVSSLESSADRDNLTRELLRCIDRIVLPNDHEEVSQQTQFIIQTVWAVGDGMDGNQFLSAITQLENMDLLLHRLFSLWMFPPPSSSLPMRLMMRVNEQSGCNVLQLLIRMAAVDTILVTPAKTRSKQVLKAMLSATAQGDLDVAAVALIHAVPRNEFDNSFTIEAQGDSIKIGDSAGSCKDVTGFPDDIEQRSNVVCEILKDSMSPLVPVFFRTLLSLYLSPPEQSIQHFEFVPMIMVPMLCEEIPTEKLVDEDDSVLSLLQIVLTRVVYQIGHGEKTPNENQSVDHSKTKAGRIQAAINSFAKVSGIHLSRLSPNPGMSTHAADTEMLLGIASILLALLTSMLELDLSIRSGESLESIGKLLVGVTRMAPHGRRQNGLDLSELSEMASHALALIHSRAASTNLGSGVRDAASLEDAIKDLDSNEPPLRARSMVILRKLANSTGIDEPGNDQSDSAKLLLQIYQLSIRALSDEESYVFLAAIHTLVVVIEKWPSKLISILGLSHLLGNSNGKKLSNDQRLKLGEAIVHVIRKKVGILDELPRLFLLYAFRSDNRADSSLSEEQRLIAHNTTRDYFVKAVDEAQDKYLKEREIRCRTGGPLFAAEEDSLVLSDRIHVVSELVAVLSTSLIADVCDTLVDCAIENLALSAERPLRRAGASLAYELYSALDRDEELNLATALAGCRHEVLVANMERVVLNKELEQRLHDPATTARCEDALRILEEHRELLVAGRIALDAKQALDCNPISRMFAPVVKFALSLDHETLL